MASLLVTPAAGAPSVAVPGWLPWPWGGRSGAGECPRGAVTIAAGGGAGAQLPGGLDAWPKAFVFVLLLFIETGIKLTCKLLVI